MAAGAVEGYEDCSYTRGERGAGEPLLLLALHSLLLLALQAGLWCFVCGALFVVLCLWCFVCGAFMPASSDGQSLLIGCC